MSEAILLFDDVPTSIVKGDEFRELTPSERSFMFSDLDLNSAFPSAPSLMRLANVRYLMDRIDTNKMPDWATLKAVTFDHDLTTAISMVSFDSINGFHISDKTPRGEKVDDIFIDELDGLDEEVDLEEIDREKNMDELRFGNAFVRKNYASPLGKKIMYKIEIINPTSIVAMELSPYDVPMYWILKVSANDPVFKEYQYGNIAYVDKKYMDAFNSSGYAGTKIVGDASDIVHFKGNAPDYQKWGVGIGQIAQLLVEAKCDMLVDFSKIIKKEAATREVFFIDVNGLTPEAAQTKINNTMTTVTQQRKFGNVMVLGKKGKEDVLDVRYVGSEGKVLDNFSMHYRADILEAIRILTRLPPSFWLGESTNKATINKQITVYNAYLSSIHYFDNRRFRREIFKPYLEQQLNRIIRLRDIPKLAFSKVVYLDATDKAMIDDIYIKNAAKSRKQVAEEEDFRLPEEDGLTPPTIGGGRGFSDILHENHQKESLGVGELDVVRK